MAKPEPLPDPYSYAGKNDNPDAWKPKSARLNGPRGVSVRGKDLRPETTNKKIIGGGKG